MIALSSIFSTSTIESLWIFCLNSSTSTSSSTAGKTSCSVSGSSRLGRMKYLQCWWCSWWCQMRRCVHGICFWCLTALMVGCPPKANCTSHWQWLTDCGPQYAACKDLAAQRAFESTTFVDYLKAYHWSIPETEELVPDMVYEELPDNDKEGNHEKENTIKQQQGVHLLIL
jgi:hypothetical protein